MLAGTIGSRATGTPANARARAYLVDQLALYGFDVRIQETDSQRPEIGLTARVANIIAVKGGARSEAIGLVAHYDSVPDAPGATDDGLGAAVCIEAARVLAARPRPNYSLMVLLTDGEELGLMGAAALITDRAITDRLHAYLELESIGSDGPSVLFETGPGNGWLVESWARSAPKPRGSSYSLEIYKRLPNDTDFSILKRTGIPGLNFAPIRDSYAYHTARDTPDRLSSGTIRQTGENAVAIVEALDHMDLSRRTPDDATYFDVGSAFGISYGQRLSRILGVLAIGLGILAGVRAIAAAVALASLGRLLVTVIGSLLALAFILVTMVGAAWLLRAMREAYQPWYAYPDRMLLWVVVTGLSSAWVLYRLFLLLPRGLRPLRHPTAVWALTLPVWVGLVVSTELRAPSASYLWTIPLLATAVALALTPLRSAAAVRLASLFVLALIGILWIPDAVDFLRFMVTVFGRAPTMTPVWVYPLVLVAVNLMIAPPLLAIVAAQQTPFARSASVTIACLLGLAITLGLAYAAPAYTFERPLRRQARYIHDGATGRAFWEVGGNEPGLDLGPGVDPLQWRPVQDAPPLSFQVRRLRAAFTFRAPARVSTSPPASVTATLREAAEHAEVEITIIPTQPAIEASFVLPKGVKPLRTNFPGTIDGLGRWTATFSAPPSQGIAFRATVRAGQAALARNTVVLIRIPALPGGTGWQRLPAWLPLERAVWSTRAIYIVPVTWEQQPDRASLASSPVLR